MHFISHSCLYKTSRLEWEVRLSTAMSIPFEDVPYKNIPILSLCHFLNTIILNFTIIIDDDYFLRLWVIRVAKGPTRILLFGSLSTWRFVAIFFVCVCVSAFIWVSLQKRAKFWVLRARKNNCTRIYHCACVNDTRWLIIFTNSTRKISNAN